MDANESSVHDERQLAAHPVGIGEPQRVERADVLDRAVGRGPLGQAVPQHAERGGRISGEREVVEMTAMEHRRTGRAVLVAEHLDRMQPRIRPGAQDRMAERRGRLGEGHLEIEHVRVELDEAVEVVGEHRDVVEAASETHGRSLSEGRGIVRRVPGRLRAATRSPALRSRRHRLRRGPSTRAGSARWPRS